MRITAFLLTAFLTVLVGPLAQAQGAEDAETGLPPSAPSSESATPAALSHQAAENPYSGQGTIPTAGRAPPAGMPKRPPSAGQKAVRNPKPPGKATAPGKPPGKATAPGKPGGKATAPGKPPGKATAPGKPPGKATAPGKPGGKATAPGKTVGKAKSGKLPKGVQDAHKTRSQRPKTWKSKPDMWTANPGKNLTPKQNRDQHFTKHKADFKSEGLTTPKKYRDAAVRFTQNPPKGTQMIVRKGKGEGQGDHLFYHPKTNRFAVTDRTGAPRTFFKPKFGQAYWDRQVKKETQ